VTTDPLFDELSEKLRLAHRQVATLDAGDEQKACATRTLLAVTNAAKHDLGRASQRLDALLADLDAGRVPPSGNGSGED
jgi:hypothetical protein